MQIQLIKCLVRLNQNGNTTLTQIVKSGPDAIPATEVPILRHLNDISDGDGDDCCITEAWPVGDVEITKAAELARLRQKYGQVVDVVYPGARGFPLTLTDCELPDFAIGKAPKAPKAVEDEDPDDEDAEQKTKAKQAVKEKA